MSCILQNHSWYDIIKEIFIPSMGVISTIFIGTIIAVFLRRKEEKTKIKGLLIDNYMLYLNKKVLFIDYELANIKYQIFRDLIVKYDDYFNGYECPILQDKINNTFYEIDLELKGKSKEVVNWTHYTYIFCFLFGKKVYDKKVQPFEDIFVAKYFSDESRAQYFNEIKRNIISNKKLINNMKSHDTIMIESALNETLYLIGVSFSDHQRKIFNPYDNRIADLIDKY